MLLFAQRRNPERELHDPAIEQRAAHLEAVRHAHAIDFHERIVRQVDLQVGVLGALHRVGRRAAAIRLGDRVDRPGCRADRRFGESPISSRASAGFRNARSA